MTASDSPHDQTAAEARPGSETLHGWIPDLADKKQLCTALEKAFDYRGDVTLTLRDGTAIAGYIFDRRTGHGLDDSVVRIMPQTSDDRIEVTYDQIARLEFSGKDTAHGRSWETWLRKWTEKKSKGEAANIYAEPLEETEA